MSDRVEQLTRTIASCGGPCVVMDDKSCLCFVQTKALLAEAYAAGREAGMREAAGIVQALMREVSDLTPRDDTSAMRRAASFLSAIGEPKT